MKHYIHIFHVEYQFILIYRPEEGMICLSRSDKNPFKVDEKIKDRTNYNSLNITNGTFYCYGEGQTYELEDLCNYDLGPSEQYCTLDTGKTIQLNPK